MSRTRLHRNGPFDLAIPSPPLPSPHKRPTRANLTNLPDTRRKKKNPRRSNVKRHIITKWRTFLIREANLVTKWDIMGRGCESIRTAWSASVSRVWIRFGANIICSWIHIHIYGNAGNVRARRRLYSIYFASGRCAATDSRWRAIRN